VNECKPLGRGGGYGVGAGPNEFVLRLQPLEGRCRLTLSNPS